MKLREKKVIREMQEAICDLQAKIVVRTGNICLHEDATKKWTDLDVYKMVQVARVNNLMKLKNVIDTYTNHKNK